MFLNNVLMVHTKCCDAANETVSAKSVDHDVASFAFDRHMKIAKCSAS